jgi:hypothetical protein
MFTSETNSSFKILQIIKIHCDIDLEKKVERIFDDEDEGRYSVVDGWFGTNAFLIWWFSIFYWKPDIKSLQNCINKQ